MAYLYEDDDDDWCDRLKLMTDCVTRRFACLRSAASITVFKSMRKGLDTTTPQTGRPVLDGLCIPSGPGIDL